MFELLQHTADLEMKVSASSLEELFAEALRGLMDLVEAEGVEDQRSEAALHLEAPDTTVLLVDFLSDALTLLHVDRVVCVGIVFDRLTPTALDGRLLTARATGFAKDVKAVTYHGAEVRCEDGIWSTALVFDI